MSARFDYVLGDGRKQLVLKAYRPSTPVLRQKIIAALAELYRLGSDIDSGLPAFTRWRLLRCAHRFHRLAENLTADRPAKHERRGWSPSPRSLRVVKATSHDTYPPPAPPASATAPPLAAEAPPETGPVAFACEAFIKELVTLPAVAQTPGIPLLDRAARSLLWDDRHCRLTRREAAVLEVLVRKKGKYVNWRSICLIVWGSDDGMHDNKLKVVICRMRHKLRASGIPLEVETLWGEGYRLSVAIEVHPPFRPQEIVLSGAAIRPLHTLLQRCSDRTADAELAEIVRQQLHSAQDYVSAG